MFTICLIDFSLQKPQNNFNRIAWYCEINKLALVCASLLLSTTKGKPAAAPALTAEQQKEKETEKILTEMPANLTCKGDIAGIEGSFDITGFNTLDKREVLGLDVSTEPADVDNSVIRFWSSNECDNSYTFVFFTDDLRALQLGQLKEVNAFVNYYNADVLGSDDTQKTYASKTINVTCSLKK